MEANDSMATGSVVAAMDAKHNVQPKQKEYEDSCSVCGRPFKDLLLQGQMIVGCPTNNMNHHAANKAPKEEPKEEVKKVVSKSKKKRIKIQRKKK